MSKYTRGPFRADFRGGYVFSGDLMFAQVRGWGQLQYEPDSEKTQDAHLQFMVDALNEKAAREHAPKPAARELALTELRRINRQALRNAGCDWANDRIDEAIRALESKP